MKSDRIQSFPPLHSRDSKILILGSIPGKESLKKQQYYGHPRNSFWRILFTLLQQPFSENYHDRLTLLNQNRIALWDVIDSCSRISSLDSDIKQAEIQDFDRLYHESPQIEAVFFNGRKAYDLYLRQYHHATEARNHSTTANRDLYLLPSTSPAHAVPFEQKLQAWRIILAPLQLEE